MIPKKPSDSIWTDEQWQAIYEEGKNIIVSAGAGSGKTAVLTERVIRKLKDNIPINKLLIVTFTKAAAEEMKDRIRKKIKKEPTIQENLNLLDESYITTFDSFALSVVKKYHYLLNISPSISIIDSNFIEIEKKKILDNIFLEYYQKEDANFLKMIDTFCTKDDIEIKQSIITISNKLDLLSNKEEYLENYIQNNFQEPKIEKDIQMYLQIIKEKINKINRYIKEISYLDAEFSLKLKTSIEILQTIEDYDDLKTKLNIKLPNAPRGSEEELKNKKKEISELLKEINILSQYKDKEEIKESILKTKDTITIMIEIIKKLTEQTNKIKQTYNSYEFNDIAILAIKIVKEKRIAREELKAQFQEIMIDEYQDTNDLQEEFISYISNNNTYMVGDIKQSIYRFRNANPYIFKNKYDNYSKDEKNLKIDLNQNFRSRKEVLDNINTIFTLIMGNKIGGADYLESHQMIFGNKKYLEEIPNHSNEMEIYTYHYDKNNNYTKEEIEAFTIADDITKKIKNHIKVFDKDTSKLREATYEDFAIIMDRSTNFDLYKKILGDFNIPVTLLKDEKMNEETDILIINNIIKLIIKIKKNEYDTELKYLWTSIARSFLFQEKDDKIFAYFEKNNFKESPCYQKCRKIAEDLPYMSIHELIDRIIDEFEYYKHYLTVGNIYSGIIKIDKLKETAINQENLGYTIYEFSDYLDELLKDDYKIEYSIPPSTNQAVKIMTIHKSKGLEYPICYFSGLYKEFNKSDLKERFTIDKNIGIIVPYFEEGIGKTIYYDLLKRKYQEEEISEKIRLFYVALTRAREKIIILNPISNKEDETNSITTLSDDIKMTYHSLSNILDSIYFRIEKNYKEINLEEIPLSKNYNIQKKINYKEQINNHGSIFDVEEIELFEKEIKEITFSSHQEKLIDKEENDKMNFGTKMHEYLEYLDLKNPDLTLIDDPFCQEKIKKLLEQNFLKNIKEATIYQEYEFIEEVGEEYQHGIIDLILEYPNHIDIIDYKLKNIHESSYQNQLTGYKKYLNKKTNKPINIYLYSLLEEEFLKID